MITISICEDEVYFAAELKKLVDEYCRLRKIHASVRIFSDGESLLASGQATDVILMDIKLPGGRGTDVIRRLRDLGSDSQVIFITAFQKYVFQAFDLDAVHCIPGAAERDPLLRGDEPSDHNAVAACMAEAQEHRSFSLTAKIKSNFLIVEAINTTSIDGPAAYGTGLKNVRQIVKNIREPWKQK